MELVRVQSKEEAKEQAAKQLNALLAQSAGTPVLLLLSGGSNIDMISYIEEHLFSSHMTIGMIDERFSYDAHVNNFMQLMAQPGFKLATNEHNVHTIASSVLPNEDISGLSERMESAWKNWMAQYENGIIITVLGIGEDGHIAGIFPNVKRWRGI